MMNHAVIIPISDTENVSGILSTPESKATKAAVIIAHGAGNDMHQPLLQFLAEGLAAGGHPALRFNFLYREKGKNSPDRQEVLYLAWQGAHRFLLDHLQETPKRVVAMGKSLGGRMASQMVAEGLLPVARLIFLGYPLHAAGKKEGLRDRHLHQITIPMLFFAGTRDPLCDLQLLQGVLDRLQAPHALELVEGGDHSFNVPKSFGVSPEEVYRRVLKNSLEWLNT